jgi:hypothetical protein
MAGLLKKFFMAFSPTYRQAVRVEKTLQEMAAQVQYLKKFIDWQMPLWGESWLTWKKGRALSFDLHTLLFLHAGLDTVNYIESTSLATAARFPHRGYLWRHLFKEYCSEDGLFLEFGVHQGESINYFADLKPERHFYGFDSFEGLPEDWSNGLIHKKGTFALKNGQPPEVRENVSLIKGWFNETLPIFLAEHPDETCAFVHIDCDIYASAKTVLDSLKEKIKPGTVLLFDEYFNYPGWRMHEFKAFQEFVEANDISYEYLGFTFLNPAVAVLIK